MVQRAGLHRLLQCSNCYTGMAIYYNMSSMPCKGIAGGGGGGSATRGDMTTSRQMRGNREGRHHRFCTSLNQNTTQQSNGMEALVDIRCWWVQGGVASRKGQSTGDRITIQRMRGCNKRQWSKNITSNHRWEIRRRVVVTEPQEDGRQCKTSRGGQEQEATVRREANAEAEVEAEAEARITMMTTRLLVATTMLVTQRVNE